MTIRMALGVAVAGLTSGCGGTPAPRSASEAPTDWRKVATATDRARLSGWRTAWVDALGQARAGGDTQAVNAQGALFEIDHALARPLPPAGNYRCRVFKLGAKGAGMQDFTAYPVFTCRVDAEGDVASFYKQGGSQRPVGLMFPSDSARGVFLGTMMLGDETQAIDYGRDATRDMAGFVERVGERRWRVVLPYPRFESTLDVVELVPAR